MKNNSDNNWNQFAKADPYFAVLANEKFHQQNLTEETLREFFQTGEDYVELVFKTIRSHFDASFQPARTLDFGCGVGRLTIPMASTSDSVLAVDVSPNMLGEAEKNCGAKGVSNVEFVRGDDSLSNVSGDFDLLMSFIVFQHIDPERGERLLRNLVGLLKEDGIGVLHFTYYKAAPRVRKVLYQARRSFKTLHRVLSYLEGKGFDYPFIQITEYDLNKLFLILQEASCDRCFVLFSKHANLHGVVLFFQKKRLAPL